MSSAGRMKGGTDGQLSTEVGDESVSETTLQADGHDDRDTVLRDIMVRKRSSGAAPDRPELLTFIMNGQTGEKDQRNIAFLCFQCFVQIGSHSPVFLMHDFTFCSHQCRETAIEDLRQRSRLPKGARRVCSESSLADSGRTDGKGHLPGGVASPSGSNEHLPDPPPRGVLRLLGDALLARIKNRPFPSMLATVIRSASRHFGGDDSDASNLRPASSQCSGCSSHTMVDPPSLASLAYVPGVEGYGWPTFKELQRNNFSANRIPSF
jgi:hypothetical protein